MKKVHNIHESYSDHYHRKYREDSSFGATVGIVLFLGGIGAIIAKEYTWAFWLIATGALSFWFFMKRARKHNKQIGLGKKITFG